MGVFCGFIRAINVRGHGKLLNQDLQALLTDCGLSGKPFMQSGNFLVSASESPLEVENRVEQELNRRFQISTQVYVRSVDQVHSCLAHPFCVRYGQIDPAHTLVYFLKEPVSRGWEGQASSKLLNGELIEALGREAFVYFPNGIAGSKLTPTLLTKLLGGPGTGRNLNTLRKMVSAAEPA